MPSLATARSFLFAPGSDARKLERALTAGADAVVADLEDAVLPEEKASARSRVLELFDARHPATLRLVRVNAVGSPWHGDDVASFRSSGIDGIVLPKADPPGAAELDVHGLPVIALVETAVGLRGAYEIACTESVEVLMLGAVDLGLDLGLERRMDGQELLFARSSLVVDSAAAGLRGPIDQVWVDIGDGDGLARDCELGRSLGFRGKSCIHPDQLATVNATFAPSQDDVARARAIVDAFARGRADGRGAVALDGELIDLPVVERAQRLLDEAKRSVLHVD